MKRWFVCLLCMAMLTSACAGAEELAFFTGMADVEYKKKDLDDSWSRGEAVEIVLSGRTAQIGGPGAAMENGELVIFGEGDYLLTGEFTGRIVVRADDEKVRLILGGVSVACEGGAAIFVEDADKATLVLAEGSENAVVSGSRMEEYDGEELDAAIYSKADLVINGPGALTVESAAGHGILSKDDLRVMNGVISVQSAKDGLRGRDAFIMRGGFVDIVSGGDGIQSNHDEDADKGYVSIDGGAIGIVSGEDGIQAETVLQVRGGEISITSGGGAAVSGAEDGKGLKAGRALFVTGGTVQIDAADDAVHSDGSVSVSGGQLTLATADDGVHAESALDVSGGTVRIAQSLEGMEGRNVRISGGEVHVVSQDDGINATGGEDDDSSGRDNPFAVEDCEILISGGAVYVNAGGDGVDSNGALTFAGGSVYVSGPTDDGDGALDASGEMTLTGGTLLAVGSSGMASAPIANGQPVTMIFMDSVQPGGQTVSVREASGNELASFTPEKEWSSAVISVPGVQEGAEIQLYVNDVQAKNVPAGEGAGDRGMFGHGGK